MRQIAMWSCLLGGLLAAAAAHSQGFAALVSPPRFELTAQPGKVLRNVIEVSNRSTAPGRYAIHTADWTLGRDYSVSFHDDLAPDSCRPWVSLERPEVVVPGGATVRYRFEVAVPADAPPGECRFGVMIEGAEPSVAIDKGMEMPVTGRIGVIVYVVIGSGGPQLELLGPSTANLNGQQVPALRVHNSGNTHGRLSGFLSGTDAKGMKYDFTPSDFPILPHEERQVFLTPSTATEDHPSLTFPVTVTGTLEWGEHTTEINQRFE